MASSDDKFFKVRKEADQLLLELNINTLPIDPFEIARRLDINLRPLPSSAGGASGLLIHVNGVFGIGFPTHIDNKGFKHFSVAHEIGHYRLPGHIDAVLDDDGRHYSNAQYRSADRYEQEADHFASALLMPANLIAAAIPRDSEGLPAIEALQEKCETSLESTAIRYTQICEDPVAVIRSTGTIIDYAFMSRCLKDFRGIEWIRKGTPLPSNSITADFNANRKNIDLGKRDEGQSSYEDWFDVSQRQEIFEEVVGLGSYGKTLTILTGMEDPDEFEDEDADLEESWAVRFRR